MKHILFSLVLFFSVNLATAAINLKLEPSRVQADDTFRLILTLEGGQNSGVPDLSPLQQDFTVVGTERSTSYSLINGQANSFNQWVIELAPKRSGTLPIPPLQVGNEKTKATTIDVEQSPDDKANLPHDDVFLLAEISPQAPYINQQIIYTVKLYNSRRLINANYEPPQVENGLLITLGNGNHYQTTYNGRVYNVAEQQYAIFPQKSGELAIKSPTFNALIYDRRPRQLKVEANRIQLKVKPKPASYGDKNWLPAKEVNLSEKYDKDTSSLTQGSTLVRTIVLRAVAVPAQLLPALDLDDSNAFSSYPEKPVEKNSFQKQEIVGTTTLKVTYLLNQAGQVNIPSLKLPWFNTLSDKEEVASLPELPIKVIAAPGTQQTSLGGSKPVSAQPVTQTIAHELIPLAIIKSKPSNLFLAWLLAAIFAAAWLLTLILWYRQKPIAKLTQNKLLKKLYKACLNGQAAEARDALLAWAQLQWPEANLLSLAAVENAVQDISLKQCIQELSQFLYNTHTKMVAWQGESLWQSLDDFNMRKSNKKHTEDPLPPMYRL